MRDIELYAQLLGLEDPWFVDDVELWVDERRVDVLVAHHEGRLWACPTCGAELPLYDHAGERRWRHLDTGGFTTFVVARPPRVECPEHRVLQVHLPWTEPKSRFTRPFERFAIDVLKETDVKGASNILRASRDECWGIMERAPDATGHRAVRPFLALRAAYRCGGLPDKGKRRVCRLGWGKRPSRSRVTAGECRRALSVLDARRGERRMQRLPSAGPCRA